MKFGFGFPSSIKANQTFFGRKLPAVQLIRIYDPSSSLQMKTA